MNNLQEFYDRLKIVDYVQPHDRPLGKLYNSLRQHFHLNNLKNLQYLYQVLDMYLQFQWS